MDSESQHASLHTTVVLENADFDKQFFNMHLRRVSEFVSPVCIRNIFGVISFSAVFHSEHSLSF